MLKKKCVNDKILRKVKPMKIALISDIHANIIALKEVLKNIKTKNVDRVYCLGDLVGYAPFPNEVIELIKELGIPTVQGNYDKKIAEYVSLSGSDYKNLKTLDKGVSAFLWSQENTTKENRDWLKGLPEQIEFEVGDKKVLLVHGSPRRNNEYLYEDSEELEEIADIINADVMVCGHTHKPFHKVVKGIHMINAGSSGKPKHGRPNATYMILNILENDIDTELIEVDYDYEKAAKTIEESEIPSEFADKIRKGIG